jgi:hypothetical protein
MMLTKWEIDKDDPDQFKILSAKRTLFAQWVFEDEELNAYELTLPVEEQEALKAKLTSGNKSAEQFEKLLWFELGKLIWKDHRQVYHEHIEYLQQNINKPLKWPMIRYIGRFREMFDYCLYLQPHSFKDQSFKEACWDERDKPARQSRMDSLRICRTSSPTRRPTTVSRRVFVPLDYRLGCGPSTFCYMSCLIM